MKKQIVLVIYFFAITISSCKKHIGDNSVRPTPLPEATQKESLIAGLNKEVASILEQVYRNDSAYKEVNAAILSEYYEDERILLRDLLYPETSEVYRTTKFREFKITAGIFKRVFNEVLNKGYYPLLKEAFRKKENRALNPATSIASEMTLQNSLSFGIFSGSTAIAIYFPYADIFVDTAMKVKEDPLDIDEAAIVAADREGNSAPGRAPYYCTAGINNICYRTVLVDDDYAEKHPTHIIDEGAQPKQETGDIVKDSSVVRVYNGWSRLTRQMDNLISLTGNGGGSEIKVARVSAYLKKESEQVTGFSGDVATVNFTRSDIRKRRWRRIFSVWDPNWDIKNTEQVYAVYEDDTKGSRTFSGTLSSTISLPGKPSPGKVQGELTYKVEVISQDDIITQRKLDRRSFFRDGMNDQGWNYIVDNNDFLPTNKNWPIYDGGTIWQYSMPWRMY